jgi:hypothetical protein
LFHGSQKAGRGREERVRRLAQITATMNYKKSECRGIFLTYGLGAICYILGFIQRKNLKLWQYF